MKLLASAVLTLAITAPALAAEADQQVAQWALHMGGAVTLEGRSAPIRDATALPDGDFRIAVLNLVGVNMHPPHMEAFAKLTALRELHLPGPMWNPRAESRTDYSAEMGHLSGLSTLKTLTFGYTFLEQIRFYDPGLEKIHSLAPTLEHLVLRRARITGATLHPFTNLRSLDITWTLIQDDGMRSLAGMTKLRRLWAREMRITDKGLEPLANLKDLEELYLGGVPVTDSGLAHLKGLTKLKKLDLLSSNVTDAGLDALNGMKDLEYLNLYRTRVSNAGLAKLKKFTKLREMDLRYTRATAAGVQDLRAALPTANLIFGEATAKPGARKPVTLAAGKSDSAAADWVKTIGGEAIIESGAIVSVSLAGTAVTDDHLRSLASLSRIRKLVLDATEVGDLGMQHVSALTSLTDLSLNNTSVSDAGVAQLSTLTALRSLSLNNTLIEGDGLKRLTTMQNLEELSLLGAPIQDSGLDIIPRLPRLKRLTLAATDITGAALKQVASLPALEYLDVGSTDIDDAGMEHLKSLTSLSELILDYSFRFTDAGFAHLSGLTNLRRLSLLRTPVTDKSLEVIAKFTRLEHLNLDYTGAGDVGLAHLAPLSQLKSVGLDSTYVTDKSRAVLLGWKHLTHLNLYHTLISAPVAGELKAVLPACRITWEAESANPNRRRS